jgi:hypothetical protein
MGHTGCVILSYNPTPFCFSSLNQLAQKDWRKLDPTSTMYLIPYLCSVAHTITGKTIYTVKILQEGLGAWQEADSALTAALEENGLYTTGAPHTAVIESHSCTLVAIDRTRTDLNAMYCAEELPPTDTETHRWHTYRLLTNTADNSIWLPPPPDATLHPFSLLGVLRHILKARGVDLVNGDGSA